ncbi:membrane protein YdbS with pleckstrin-like domain [Kineosphaera limosa]|uniref:YdbS-like PH domain-containing protein n=1 Tax=Kineosphaera limosa NBRC 100340 TaxID=1184609 RepID=K6X1A7_9MICO|nr:PH domain-containing protein [Kineosphaera limosa]NYE00268.1 membrane protein YdbS with pleckstrin-like domain [Kineosphaera limosa]GAB98157.1 hypothetical protein KILIM_107_00020 [Kineosphaera limosa NBRC 100340]
MPARNLDHLERYLLRGEKIVVAVHRHWGVVAEPVALAILGLIAAVWLSATLDPSAGQLADLVWWLAFALVGRALFYLWEWHREWFIATDRRLLLIYGFIVRKVDMMPLGKVTDMTYHRTVLGRLLGYGTFVLESAGQDQALSNLAYMPRPDATYKAIIAQIFHRDGDEPVDGPDEDYEDEVYEEEDPTRRSRFAQHLQRFSGRRGGRDERQVGPIREVRDPRHTASFYGDGEVSRARGEVRRHPHGRGGEPDDYEDDDTAGLDLRELRQHSRGHTIYRSTDGDGTEDPGHNSSYDDPTRSWRWR